MITTPITPVSLSLPLSFGNGLDVLFGFNETDYLVYLYTSEFGFGLYVYKEDSNFYVIYPDGSFSSIVPFTFYNSIWLVFHQYYPFKTLSNDYIEGLKSSFVSFLNTNSHLDLVSSSSSEFSVIYNLSCGENTLKFIYSAMMRTWMCTVYSPESPETIYFGKTPENALKKAREDFNGI